MNFVIVFALALSTASAYRMGNSKLGITNGYVASEGQFPYQVGLGLELRDNTQSWCGGSVISNEFVLSAAHCTYDALAVTVYLGATDSSKPEIEHRVTYHYIVNHQDFQIQNFQNDISVIRIPHTGYTDLIKPITLPSLSESYSSYEGDISIASGWGRISDSERYVTNILRWAYLRIIANDECNQYYGIVLPSNICVSTPGGVSTCQGDSGGPLVLTPSNVQVGLTSFGAKAGCTRGYPVAFTRVTSYLDWIKHYTGVYY